MEEENFILYICTKCSFYSRVLNDYNKHNCERKTLNEVNLIFSSVLSMNEKIKVLENENNLLKKKLKTITDQNQRIKNDFQNMKDKNNIYIEIIKKYTNIVLPEEQQEPQEKKVPKYRKIKKLVKEEKPELEEEKVKKGEENINAIINENFDISIKDTTELINDTLNNIEKNRIYRKYLPILKENRNKLLGRLNLEDYKNLILQNINKLQNIFDSKSVLNKVDLVRESLSPLDQRLISYQSYYNSRLEADEIQTFKLSLDVSISNNFPKRYLPFVIDNFFNRIYNYGIVIFPLSESLKRALVNPYRFFDICYVKLPKSTENDPYSFYILENIKEKRYWKLECRLYNLSNSIRTNLLTYCINIFRKIYYDVFKDNIFRENYKQHSIIFEQDSEQLLLNIIALSQKKYFCSMLKNIIKENNTIEITEHDHFNLIADDIIIKNSFNKEQDDDKYIIESIKRLFDDISDDEANTLNSSIEK